MEVKEEKEKELEKVENEKEVVERVQKRLQENKIKQVEKEEKLMEVEKTHESMKKVLILGKPTKFFTDEKSRNAVAPSPLLYIPRFPNPPRHNNCWLNAALQLLICAVRRWGADFDPQPEDVHSFSHLSTVLQFISLWADAQHMTSSGPSIS